MAQKRTTKTTGTKKTTQEQSIDYPEVYVNYLLENERRPSSVYQFARTLGIEEAFFYQSYNSLESLERDVWNGFLVTTLERIKSDAVYGEYSVREKLLAFYFTFIEVLKEKRSFVQMAVSLQRMPLQQLPYWTKMRETFKGYVNELLQEGVETEEVVQRSLLMDTYPNLFWMQAVFVLKFWLNDDSKDFEQTDAAIEKAVNLSFDLVGKTFLDSLFDFGKFVFQQKK